MTSKQLKALRRRKAIAKRRNIRTNNVKRDLTIPIYKRSRTYQLYDI